jgi:hypothetical protein
MALQPIVGPWPLLQFRNHFYTVGKIPWTSDRPIARPLPKHRTTQTQNKPNRDIYALSGIRTHDTNGRAGEDSSCLRPRGHSDQPCHIIQKTTVEIFTAVKTSVVTLSACSSVPSSLSRNCYDKHIKRHMFYYMGGQPGAVLCTIFRKTYDY